MLKDTTNLPHCPKNGFKRQIDSTRKGIGLRSLSFEINPEKKKKKTDSNYEGPKFKKKTRFRPYMLCFSFGSLEFVVQERVRGPRDRTTGGEEVKSLRRIPTHNPSRINGEHRDH